MERRNKGKGQAWQKKVPAHFSTIIRDLEMVVVPDPNGAGPVELLKKEQAADFVGKGEG